MDVDLWRADLEDEGWPGPEGLPAPERERAERMPAANRRRRWVASRWALRGALADHLEIEPAAVPIELAPGGKPRLAGGAEPRFSLSHSGSVALIAVCSGGEVGVDVERIDPDRDVLRLAPRALGPAADAVRNAPVESRHEVFHAAWARREAIAKCAGTGLGDPDEPEPAGIVAAPVEAGAGYAAVLALDAARMPRVRMRVVAPPARGGGTRSE